MVNVVGDFGISAASVPALADVGAGGAVVGPRDSVVVVLGTVATPGVVPSPSPSSSPFSLPSPSPTANVASNVAVVGAIASVASLVAVVACASTITSNVVASEGSVWLLVIVAAVAGCPAAVKRSVVVAGTVVRSGLSDTTSATLSVKVDVAIVATTVEMATGAVVDSASGVAVLSKMRSPLPLESSVNSAVARKVDDVAAAGEGVTALPSFVVVSGAASVPELVVLGAGVDCTAVVLACVVVVVSRDASVPKLEVLGAGVDGAVVVWASVVVVLAAVVTGMVVTVDAVVVAAAPVTVVMVALFSSPTITSFVESVVVLSAAARRTAGLATMTANASMHAVICCRICIRMAVFTFRPCILG